MNASLILTNIERAAKSFLSGSQYEMDSMGTEKIIHSINYLRDQHETWDTVGMDQKNAFNVVFRTLMATKIMYHFPQLMNYFRTFYFYSSSLVFSDPQTQAMIEFFSCEGVQQGDPLAPFLFCLASLDYVKTIQNLVDTGIAPAFFDDINIVGPTHNCLAAIKYARESGPSFGLYPQPHKFGILLGVCDDYEQALTRKQTYATALGLDTASADKCIKIHPDNAPDANSKVLFAKRYGLRVLGAPIGSDEFIQDWLQVAYLKLLKESEILQKSISTLHVQWNLIYYCLRNKVNHLFRVISPRLTRQFCNTLDTFFRQIMERNIQSELPLAAWTQLKLSFEEGGNGFGDTFSIAYAGFLASSLSCFDTVLQIVHNPNIVILNDSTSTWISDIWSTASKFNSLIEGPTFTINDLLLLRGPQMQRVLTSLLDKKIGNDFHKSYANPTNRARKLSVRSSETSGFLRATPVPNVTLLTNSEWCLSNRLRLGLALQIVPHNLRCICKGRPKVDRQGYHFFDCKHGNERIVTHNDLSIEWFLLAKSAGLSGQLETLLDRSVTNRRADLILYNPDFQFCQEIKEFHSISSNVDFLFDVKVGFPCSATYITKGSHKKASVTCNDGHYKKLQKYPQTLLRGRGFLPLSIESFGRFHSSVKPFIGLLCSKASAISGVPHSVLVNYWSNRISASLQKNIAKMMVSRVDRIVCSSHVSLPSAYQKAKTKVPNVLDVRHPRVVYSSHSHFRH